VEEVFTLNLGRLIFVLIVFIFFSFLAFKTKKYFFYSTLFLFVLIPFNITLQVPNFSVYISGISSNYLIPTFHLIDVFVFFLLCAALKEGKIFKIEKKLKIFFSVLFLFFTIKAFVDFNILSTLLIYRTFFYAFSAFLIIKEFHFKKHLKLLSKILLFSILIQLLIGILQFKLGHSLGLIALGESQVVKGMFGSSFIDLNGTLFLRAYGTFPHPNVLASFLLFSTFFCLYYIKDRISLIAAALSTILIFLTFSRIVILLVILVWVVFFAHKIFLEKKLLSLSPLFVTRFLNIFSERDSSFSDRLDLITLSKEILQQHPYFGIGVGKFLYGIDYHPVYTTGGFLLLQPVHNIFLLILSEYGFVFGIPLILFLGYVLLFRGFFKSSVRIKLLAFLVLVLAFFDHYFLTLPQGLFVFSLLLSFIYLKKARTFF
jgi:hypothetical protein